MMEFYEPWSVKDHGYWGVVILNGNAKDGASYVAEISGKDDEVAARDARRIVSCVNACAGSDEDWLDGYAAGLHTGTRKLPLVDQFKLLKSQRDELLAALKAIYDRHNAETMAQARNVIAKCEAQS